MMSIAYKSLPFDVEKDLAPLSLVSKRSSLLMVPAGLPIHNMKDLVVQARANPGKLNYGTASVGGITHLAAAWLHHAIEAPCQRWGRTLLRRGGGVRVPS